MLLDMLVGILFQFRCQSCEKSQIARIMPTRERKFPQTLRILLLSTMPPCSRQGGRKPLPTRVCVIQSRWVSRPRRDWLPLLFLFSGHPTPCHINQAQRERDEDAEWRAEERDPAVLCEQHYRHDAKKRGE